MGGRRSARGANGTQHLDPQWDASRHQRDVRQSLSYQGTLNYNGPDTLTVTSTDGNSATDVDTVGITVTAVNDAPVNTVPGAQVVAEDTALGHQWHLSVNDVDGNL